METPELPPTTILTEEELPALPFSPYLYTEWRSVDERVSSTMYTAAQLRQAQRDTEAAVIAKIKAQGAVGAMLKLSGEVWDMTSGTNKWDHLVQDDPRYSKHLLYTLPGDTP